MLCAKKLIAQPFIDQLICGSNDALGIAKIRILRTILSPSNSHRGYHTSSCIIGSEFYVLSSFRCDRLASGSPLW